MHQSRDINWRCIWRRIQHGVVSFVFRFIRFQYDSIMSHQSQFFKNGFCWFCKSVLRNDFFQFVSSEWCKKHCKTSKQETDYITIKVSQLLSLWEFWNRCLKRKKIKNFFRGFMYSPRSFTEFFKRRLLCFQFSMEIFCSPNFKDHWFLLALIGIQIFEVTKISLNFVADKKKRYQNL